ncbi:MAG TPA: hypothetical protein VHV51_04185 [Polyangiaceae bacterium]|jgi:hypothetical protein|nr:hypothetical protein [Polyangiaceae bacterium]
MTTSISTSSTTGFASEIAALIIQTETTQEDSDRLARDAARNAFLTDAQKQVDELHAGAAAGEAGALAGAAFSIAGAACNMGAAVDSYDADTVDSQSSAKFSDQLDAKELQTAGSAFTSLSGVASQVAGGRESGDDAAEAKRYEALQAQDKWQADDASSEIDKADKLGDKIMDIVQSLDQDQNQANNAIIGRI